MIFVKTILSGAKCFVPYIINSNDVLCKLDVKKYKIN